MPAKAKGEWTTQVPSSTGLYFVANQAGNYGVAEITQVEDQLLAQIWGATREYPLPRLVDEGLRAGWRWWSEPLPAPVW